MKVKTSVKAGKIAMNHNEKLLTAAAKSLKVKTNVKGGIREGQHNETLVRG